MAEYNSSPIPLNPEWCPQRTDPGEADDSISLSLQKLRLIDASKTPWEQILEFRRDRQARQVLFGSFLEIEPLPVPLIRWALEQLSLGLREISQPQAGLGGDDIGDVPLLASVLERPVRFAAVPVCLTTPDPDGVGARNDACAVGAEGNRRNSIGVSPQGR